MQDVQKLRLYAGLLARDAVSLWAMCTAVTLSRAKQGLTRRHFLPYLSNAWLTGRYECS